MGIPSDGFKPVDVGAWIIRLPREYSAYIRRHFNFNVKLFSCCFFQPTSPDVPTSTEFRNLKPPEMVILRLVTSRFNYTSGWLSLTSENPFTGLFQKYKRKSLHQDWFKNTIENPFYSSGFFFSKVQIKLVLQDWLKIRVKTHSTGLFHN